MAIARRVRWYLDHHEADYEIVPHPPTGSSLETAAAAHVPPERLAKCVLLEDERGYLLTVLPASRKVDLDELREALARDLELAGEAELGEIFDDCEVGAVPPLGFAYGIPTIIDESLLHQSDVWFEAGEHRDLVHMRGLEFAGLMSRSPHATLSREAPAEPEPVRDREAREERLDQDQAHVFALTTYGESLREQPEYTKDGHTGMILMKTPELRVVLEVARAGTRLASHQVHGQTTLHVIAGALDVESNGGVSRVGPSEIAVLPRDEQREIRAAAESLFLIAVAPARSAEA